MPGASVQSGIIRFPLDTESLDIRNSNTDYSYVVKIGVTIGAGAFDSSLWLCSPPTILISVKSSQQHFGRSVSKRSSCIVSTDTFWSVASELNVYRTSIQKQDLSHVRL